MSILTRDKTFSQPVNWTAAFMAAFHVGAIGAALVLSQNGSAESLEVNVSKVSLSP
jgi:hypothetical protein